MVTDMKEYIQLSHGSGLGQYELLEKVIFPILFPDTPFPVEDASSLNRSKDKLAFTTDSFVITPIVFPGGDIGKLAACGTLNDLSMVGAVPQSLSLSLILEEGLEIELLKRILHSFLSICRENNVRITCGDTKVVDKGKVDGLFINTSGIGYIPEGLDISVKKARPGDAVIVSGPIGLHGIAVLASRKGLNFASGAKSDCACLTGIVQELVKSVKQIHSMRDCTRGGCASILNEIAAASGVSIILNEEAVPVPEVVLGACSYLGMDPLHIPCEGRFVIVLPEQKAETALGVLHNHPLGHGAAIIGRIKMRDNYPVVLKTRIGGLRLVDYPPGELLPRIC
jgi:hydrogenase expression/formation protein HypE